MKKFESGERYAGRRADVAVINCSLPREAVALLRKHSGGRKLGALISRLIYEHEAAQQERARLKQEVLMTLDRED